MKAIRRLRELAGDRSGAAAVELALVAPILVGILVPMTDLGMGAYAKMQVQNAANAGAQYALEHGFNTTSITTIVQSATSLGANVSLSPTPAEACYCITSNAMSIQPGDASAPAPPCATGACADGSTPGTFVSVDTSYSFSPLIAFSVPGLHIPSTYTLTGTAVVRIQ